jgi:hypothetical protein
VLLLVVLLPAPLLLVLLPEPLLLVGASRICKERAHPVSVQRQWQNDDNCGLRLTLAVSQGDVLGCSA